MVALALTVALWSSVASAKKNPEAAALAKIEKDAAKAAKAITKATAREIRAAAVVTSKELKLLAKTAKKGGPLPQFAADRAAKVALGRSGDVSPLVLFEAARDSLANFHTNAASTIRNGREDITRNAALSALAGSTSPARDAGTRGSVPDFINAQDTAAWARGTATVNKALDKFRKELEAAGFEFSYVNCVPPKTISPVLGSTPGPLIAVPTILVTMGDPVPRAHVLVLNPAGLFADRGPTNVVLFSDPSAGFARLGSVADSTQVTFINDIGLSAPTDNSGTFRSYLATTWEDTTPTTPLSVALYRYVDNTFSGADDTNLGAIFGVVTGDPSASLDGQSLTAGGVASSSDPTVPDRPVESIVDLIFVAINRTTRGAQKIGAVFSGDFPCGAGPNGFTVCPEVDAGDPGGDLLVVGVQHGAEIPLNDRDNSYQFGFVFDQDGRSGNNYVPIPRFSRDFFRDTDKWYSVEYTPQAGWQLKVTDARGGSFVSVQSAARAIILGDSILLVVPASEFEVASPAFRVTSFRHTGDFGLNPPYDYSADYDPVPGKALRKFQVK